MPYAIDMPTAARRHLLAGDRLYVTDRKDVAGYLYGLAAECALKALMSASSMRPLAEQDRRDDPFYAHFGDLRTLVSSNITGRLSAQVRRFVERANFMQFWDIRMRYSNGRDIRPEWVDRWKEQAAEIVAIMNTEV